MYELVYTSDAHSNICNQDFLDILKKAVEFNAVNNITGCLLFHNFKFIQFLEGEKKDVKSLFLKIKKDNKHFNVLKIKENYKKNRSFGNWVMAFYNFEHGKMESTEKLFLLNTTSWFSILPVEHTAGIRMFQTLSKQLLQKLKNVNASDKDFNIDIKKCC